MRLGQRLRLERGRRRQPARGGGTRLAGHPDPGAPCAAVGRGGCIVQSHPDPVAVAGRDGAVQDDAAIEAARAEAAKQPPMPPPQIMAAEIREKGATERKAMDLKADETRLMAEAHMEKSRQDFEARESEKDRQLQAMQLEVEAQLAREDLSSDERIALEREKVLLANVALRLKVQQQMAAESRAHQRDSTVAGHMVDLHKFGKTPQVASPAVEPAGRAEAGQAFTE